MLFLKELLCSGLQFVYPDPKACLAGRQGCELIIPAPFRAGVFRDNQFVDQGK